MDKEFVGRIIKEQSCSVFGSERLAQSTMSLDLDKKLQLDDEVEEPIESLWVKYVRRGNPMKVNAEGISRRLKDLSPKLFCQPEKMEFDILDIASKCVSQVDKAS
jgi:hypothetical protein